MTNSNGSFSDEQLESAAKAGQDYLTSMRPVRYGPYAGWAELPQEFKQHMIMTARATLAGSGIVSNLGVYVFTDEQLESAAKAGHAYSNSYNQIHNPSWTRWDWEYEPESYRQYLRDFTTANLKGGTR
jgi:hypothetical protein